MLSRVASSKLRLLTDEKSWAEGGSSTFAIDIPTKKCSFFFCYSSVISTGSAAGVSEGSSTEGGGASSRGGTVVCFLGGGDGFLNSPVSGSFFSLGRVAYVVPTGG